MLGVIEVGIPVNSRTTHATLELSFLVGDAFIMVKVIGLGLYTMHTAQHPSIPSHKKKHQYHLTFDFYYSILFTCLTYIMN